MHGDLPVFIDPLRLAELGGRIAGRLPLGNMARLAAATAACKGAAEVDLSFGIDGGGNRYVRGRVTAEVELVCQRCLEPYACALAGEVSLAVVEALDAAAPDGYEPLACSGRARLLELVEDELLLALPLVARHPTAACGADLAARETNEEKRTNPFSVLEHLKDEQGGGKP